MPEPSTLLLFAASAAVLVFIPGPNLVYIVTRSIEAGRRAGLASMLGVEAGTVVHVTAAALRLSALLPRQRWPSRRLSGGRKFAGDVYLDLALAAATGGRRA